MNRDGSPGRIRREKDDQRLVRRIVQREAAAVARLYDRYADLVYSLALRVLKDAPRAETVVVETFWQVWRQPHSYDNAHGSVAAWILAIARQRVAAARRGPDPHAETAARPEGFIHTPTPATRLTEAPPATEPRDAVIQALSQLPEPDRLALELAYYGGLTCAEISERTGEPLETVKARMRCALLRLREHLGPVPGQPRAMYASAR